MTQVLSSMIVCTSIVDPLRLSSNAGVFNGWPTAFSLWRSLCLQAPSPIIRDATVISPGTVVIDSWLPGWSARRLGDSAQIRCPEMIRTKREKGNRVAPAKRWYVRGFFAPRAALIRSDRFVFSLILTNHSLGLHVLFRVHSPIGSLYVSSTVISELPSLFRHTASVHCHRVRGQVIF